MRIIDLAAVILLTVIVIVLGTASDVARSAEPTLLVFSKTSAFRHESIPAGVQMLHDWPWYAGLVGAWFESHPEIQDAIVDVTDREHPSTEMLPLRWERTDGWYNYDRNPRGSVHVLLTLDETTYEGGEHDGDHPIAWCHNYEGARSWYTGGGHTVESYAEPLFRQHVLGGIRWVLGAEDGDCHSSLQEQGTIIRSNDYALVNQHRRARRVCNPVYYCAGSLRRTAAGAGSHNA